MLTVVHTRVLRRAARIGSLLLILAACGKAASTAPSSFVVSYHLSGTSGVVFDSVKYHDAQGAMVKVSAPPANWSVVFTVNAGGYVGSDAWASATGAGQVASLQVTWTASGVSTASDSSSTTTSSAGSFMLSTPRHPI
jgi:hypothetical protein